MKAKSAAIIALKTLIVNAPGDLREALEPLTDRKLIDRCAGAVLLLLFGLLRSGQVKLRALVGYHDMGQVKKAA